MEIVVYSVRVEKKNILKLNLAEKFHADFSDEVYVYLANVFAVN